MINPQVLWASSPIPRGRELTAHRRVDGVSEVAIELPPIGPCPSHRCLFIFIFDDSASVVGGKEDCVGGRYAETRLALEYKAKRCRCRRESGVVLHFDRGTGFDAGPARFDRVGLVNLRRSLRVPPIGPGSSELGGALEDAEELALAHPHHASVLCVVTDFELLDADVDNVLARMCAFPGSVHAVALQSEPPPCLSENGVSVTKVGWDSAPGTTARAILAALVAPRRVKVAR